MKTAGMVLLLSLCAVSVSWAHPPTKIAMSFDPKTRELTAEITHPVDKPGQHFVGKVEVLLNKKQVITHELSRQENDTAQTVVYKMTDVESGDILEVEAYCNINGKLTDSISVP